MRKIIVLLVSVIILCTACSFKQENEKKELVFSERFYGKGSSGSSTTVTVKPQQQASLQTPVITPKPTIEPTPQATPETKATYLPIVSNKKLKLYEDTGTAVIGDTGFEIYNYVSGSSKNYAKAINRVAKKLGKSTKVYNLIVPTSVGITLPDNYTKKVNSSNQKDSLHKISKQLSGSVKKISLYDQMMQHRTEYIYFRTDHHWTHLGAYYAYEKFCQETGRTPNSLSQYKKSSFGKFLGTYYLDSHKNKKLRKDIVEAYYPLGKHITMKYKNESGKMVTGKVIADASNFGLSGKYIGFLCGDNSYTEITNKDIKDGSSCIVVKESYGNAFVPYLSDHYHKIYVIDYRYWSGKLSPLVKKKKAQEVIFINNISMTRNAYLVGKLAQISS